MSWRQILAWNVRTYPDIEPGFVVRLKRDADWAALYFRPTREQFQMKWVVATVDPNIYGEEYGSGSSGFIEIYPVEVYDMGTAEDLEHKGIALDLETWDQYLEPTGEWYQQ